MFRFLIKKNFCDIWDNLFHLMVINLFIVLSAAICLAVVMLMAALPGPAVLKDLSMFVSLAFFCVVMGILFFAEGDNALKIASFEGAKLSRYFGNILPSIKDGALFGLYLALVVAIALVSMPYYFHVWIPEDGSQGSLLGLLMMSLVFWFIIITVLSLQYFLPVRSMMHNGFRKCLKKSYMIFFDNTAFTIGLGFLNLVNIAVAVFSFGILNGAATVTVSCTEALRLLMYKYDWYEVNPGLTKEQRKDVPWDDLIANDKKMLGPRRWKSFLFPWKE
ncbi:MAG: hypothetical protein IJU95_00785 [Treponema sp.]|nr:hypothetical protein [Treponema sp.]